ncbi:hypothetical protein B4096_2220 [Heyndrickxia coagulans]|jgi:hypothetical protein|nr:hypothetical protein B4096_2220 [Heyndrickxia coagulans]
MTLPPSSSKRMLTKSYISPQTICESLDSVRKSKFLPFYKMNKIFQPCYLLYQVVIMQMGART